MHTSDNREYYARLLILSYVDGVGQYCGVRFPSLAEFAHRQAGGGLKGHAMW